MIGMDQYELIRTASRVYHKSIRQIARETGHCRKTIRKVLKGMEPLYRRQKSRFRPRMEPVAAVVQGWLETDRQAPRKQRHTSRRIFTRLVEEYNFEGAQSSVRRWVREFKAQRGDGRVAAVIPLDPEVAREAEVDWGSAQVVMAGEPLTVKLFCMRSRYSGKPFVRAYPWERQEMFFDGHQRAFDYFGGVFPILVFDNLTSAVAQVLRGQARREQQRFISFRSYYSFEARFCNPARGQEKGGVEGLVGYARRNFLVPIPEVESFEELNALLLERCLEQGTRPIAGREDRRTIEERHEEEQARLISLPATPFENHKLLPVKVSRYSTVQVDRNRYSVPTAYVGRWMEAQMGCDRVRVYADQTCVADHARLFGNSKWQIHALHYLALIHQRIGAFETARPIRQWRAEWPSDYETLLGQLRRRLGDNRGTREFVEVLQLHGSYPAERIQSAVAEALQFQTYGYEAVKHLLVRQDSPGWQCPPLECDLIPGVTDRQIALGDLSHYDRLLEGGAR
ncbi:MAG: IS21 family transposase [Acidobacteriia bacterium]|nr:IS21 family transposase [Terriglobia bacterium]